MYTHAQRLYMYVKDPVVHVRVQTPNITQHVLKSVRSLQNVEAGRYTETRSRREMNP